MNNKRNTFILGLFSYCIVLFLLIFLVSCEPYVPESRIYLEDDTSNSFTAVYIVESPNGSNGDWGQNLINDYEVLEEYDWKMYVLDPGTYDIKLEYEYDTWTDTAGETERLGVSLGDEEGVKYHCSNSGYFFTTTFTFVNPTSGNDTVSPFD